MALGSWHTPRFGPGARVRRADVVICLPMRLRSTRRPTGRLLASSTAGVVFVEYVALLTLVTVVGAVTVVGLGVPLLELFRFSQAVISLPVP